MGRLLLALAALCVSSAAIPRSYGVEDFLSMESYGQVIPAPRVGILLVERRRPYADAPDFGYGGYFVDRSLGRIMAADLSTPQRGLRPLFAQESDAGYWMGSLSPSGTRVTVFRLKARRLSLGVVDLRTGVATWLPVAPDLLSRDPAPAWLDERRLLVAETPSGALPRLLRLGSTAGERLAALYADQARGSPSWTSATSLDGARPNIGKLTEVEVDGLRRATLFHGEIVDFAVAPDGSSVAVVTAGLAVAPPPSPIGVSFASRRRPFALISLRRDRGLPLARLVDVAPNVLEWSRSGRLLVVARHGEAADWKGSRFLSVRSDGTMATLGGTEDRAYAQERGDGLRFDAHWSGSSVVALVRRGDAAGWRLLSPGRSVGLNVPPEARTVVHDGVSLVIGAAGADWLVRRGAASRLPAGVRPLAATSLDPFSSGARDGAGPCGRVSLVGASEPSGSRGASLCPTGARLRAGDDVLAALPTSLVAHSVDERGVETLALVGSDGVRLDLDTINARLADVALPRAVRLETVGRDGARLSHWLLLPASAAAPPRLVVQPYPGRVFGAALPPDARPWRFGVGTNALLLTGAGMAVLQPSMPRRDDANPVELVVPEVAEAVAAARATGLVDASRPAVMGHSFGGWAAVVLAERMACVGPVVAANGVYDLTAAHATMAGPDRVDLPLGIPFAQSTGWTEAGQGAMLATPWREPARYAAASPLLRAGEVRTPLLLITGDLDPVDMAQSERMFMEVARIRGDATLLRFWGEGHAVSSPGNVRAYWSAVTSFLAASPTRPTGTADGCS